MVMIAVAFLRDLPAVQEKLEQSQQNSEGKCPTTKFGRNISCSNTFVLLFFVVMQNQNAAKQN